jgi:hypothetical protein
MTLIIQKPTTSKLILAKGYPNDPEVLAYIAAVQAADETASPGIGALEIGTVKAIDDFVTGCKSDGIWSAIKASCILAGARTLTGALVPLAGTAPTNVSSLFVADDYNRKTGLVGAAGKTLNSNRNNNADPQNSKHVGVYATTITTALNQSYAATSFGSGFTSLNTLNATTVNFNINANSGPVTVPNVIGFLGANRSASNIQQARTNNATVQNATASQSPRNENIILFNGVAMRLAFYSIGESLNLALLDARVTDLINAFAAAIP